jgi:transporter family protein
MKPALSWQALAVASAVCAALSAIFAKVGVEGVNADLATFIRTAIILAVFAALLTLTQQWQPFSQLSMRTWLFLALSALAAGGLGCSISAPCSLAMRRASLPSTSSASSSSPSSARRFLASG